MWGVGCVVYELFTGHILFPGKTNNEMLKLMMDVKGPFPKKMLRRAEFGFKHFENDASMSFSLMEEDPVTKQPVGLGLVWAWGLCAGAPWAAPENPKLWDHQARTLDGRTHAPTPL